MPIRTQWGRTWSPGVNRQRRVEKLVRRRQSRSSFLKDSRPQELTILPLRGRLALGDEKPFRTVSLPSYKMDEFLDPTANGAIHDKLDFFERWDSLLEGDRVRIIRIPKGDPGLQIINRDFNAQPADGLICFRGHNTRSFLGAFILDAPGATAAVEKKSRETALQLCILLMDTRTCWQTFISSSMPLRTSGIVAPLISAVSIFAA